MGRPDSVVSTKSTMKRSKPNKFLKRLENEIATSLIARRSANFTSCNGSWPRAVMRPLARGDAMQRKWIDGRPTKKIAESFIKPNDRLTSFERLEIYNRQYWFRVRDCFYEDYPGLRAILGDKKFERLADAYLAKYPSQSYTLRNLGSRLVKFLEANPRWTSPHPTTRPRHGAAGMGAHGSLRQRSQTAAQD